MPALLVLVSLLLCCVATADQTAPAEPERSIQAVLASRSLLLDGTVVDGRLVAVGERGHILTSDDDGLTWNQVSVPTRATLTGVFFIDEKLGWAVGHDAVILRTRDSGTSWERVYHAPEEERPLFDLWFRDADNGFAIGAYGYFLVTTDGGENWESRDLEAIDRSGRELDEWGEVSDWHLNQVARSAAGHLYIAAEAGSIYRSDDEGATWISLPSPYEGSFFGILPLDEDALLVFGLRGSMYHSADAGMTWEQVKTDTQAMLTAGLRLPDGTIVIVGLEGTVLFSRDGGRHFTLEQQADRQGFSSVMQAGDGQLILVGEFGVKRISLE